MFRLIGDLLFPGGRRARLAILMYHRVPVDADPILQGDMDAATFERHMHLLATEFHVLRLGDACALLARGRLPARAVCITFDDGYADSETVALPILKRLGLQASFFVSTGYSDGGIMFNDALIEGLRRAPPGTHDLASLGMGIHHVDDFASRRAAIDAIIGALKYRPHQERAALVDTIVAKMRSTVPKDLMMRPDQIKRLHDEGMEIGAHTVNHPILTGLDETRARAEIVGGKRRLEDIIGTPVGLFAYPNGKPGRDYGPRDVQLVKEAGFSAAVSTIPGVATSADDLFQLPRVDPWYRDPRRLGVQLLLGSARANPWRANPTT